MEFREHGKTGRQVSVIGLGCEHLDGKPYHQVKETIDAALEQGVNILDVFMPGKEIRENIAKALGSRRGEVMIQGHIGSTDVNEQYDKSRDLPVVKRYFEDLLRIFGGYIDFGMMFFIDSEEDYKGVFETDFAEYVQRLKRQGDIGHIGFSSHSPEMAMKALKTGLPEVMMFSINPAFDMIPLSKCAFDYFEGEVWSKLFRGVDPKRAELYELCTQLRIGVTVMKTFGAGKLISPEHTPFARPLTTTQCIHYALSKPNVSSVLTGCKTAAEVLDTVSYLVADDAQRDYSEILSAVRDDFRGSCMYCGHCRPCPAGIDVASVHKYLDIARLDITDIPLEIRQHYSSLPHSGDECVACGNCEKRCPFGVPIVKNMAEAERLLRSSM